jgi:hypothetical protein
MRVANIQNKTHVGFALFKGGEGNVVKGAEE